MKVLLIKTSSLGDVIHTLPAVTEAAEQVEDLELTWIVEENLVDVVNMHPSVARVIPVAIRRWRRSWGRCWPEVRTFITELKDTQYDLVVDSQGLFKSALLTLAARGEIHGFGYGSARESLAAGLYRHRHAIDRTLHAVTRQKQILAASLGYPAGQAVSYGLQQRNDRQPEILFLHGTTWTSKEWPLSSWQTLADLVARQGYRVMVPAGNRQEEQTALAILRDLPGEVLVGMTLRTLTDAMRRCTAVVSVDTGLGHLAVALDLPTVGLYGATDPVLTGLSGQSVHVIVNDHLPCIPCKKRVCSFRNPGDSSNIYPPCFLQTTPERVWQALQRQIGSKDTRPD